MTSPTEALKMAIEAMEYSMEWYNIGDEGMDKFENAINACKEALASNCDALENKERNLFEEIKEGFDYLKEQRESQEQENEASSLQEPVAWMTKWENENGEIKYAVYEEKIGKFDIPLYAHPAQADGASSLRTPLSDDEIMNVWSKMPNKANGKNYIIMLSRAIEQAHGIGVKNETHKEIKVINSKEAYEDIFKYGNAVEVDGKRVNLNNVTRRQSLENNPQSMLYVGRRFDD